MQALCVVSLSRILWDAGKWRPNEHLYAILSDIYCTTYTSIMASIN